VEGILRQAADVDDVEHRIKEYEQGKFIQISFVLSKPVLFVYYFKMQVPWVVSFLMFHNVAQSHFKARIYISLI
jgi:hypothetical protein